MNFEINGVAPFAGAWIEIGNFLSTSFTSFVAPFAGAWIEIAVYGAMVAYTESLPSRKRGLKSPV